MANASSTFDGTENPLSEGGTWGTPTGADAMKKTSGFARGTTLGLKNLARLVTPTIGPNQFSEIEVEDAAPFYPAACVRMQAGNMNCYMLECNDDGQGTVQIIRFEDAGPTLVVLGADIVTTMDQNDKFKLTVKDTTLKAYKNGTFLAERTDSTYATGQPGIRNEGDVANDGINSWSGGDLMISVRPDYSQFPKYKLRTTR